MPKKSSAFVPECGGFLVPLQPTLKTDLRSEGKKMINFNQDISYLWGEVCNTLVPFYDVPISCGLPNEVGDIPAEMIRVPGDCIDGLENYTVRAKGDSMIGVNIHDGDLLMMKKIDQVHNYDIVLAIIDGESLIKTYYQDDKGRHWLVPANDAYEPILLTEDMDLYFGGKVIYNMSQPRDSRSNICRRIAQYDEERMAPKPEPATSRIPTQEEVEEAIRWVEPYVEGARHWLGPCRVLMDCGFIARDDYETFCQLVKYVLPNLKTKPTKAELRRMATFCFSKSFEQWTDAKAPIHGEHYLKYYRAGEAMQKKLP